MIPPELREALEPSDEELTRFGEPLAAGLLASLASATEPSAAELARLQPRQPRRARPLWLVAVAAALLTFVLLPRPDAPGTIAPGVEVYGSAAVALVNEDVLLVELQDGLAVFRAEERVLVRAGGVDVDFEDARLSILLDDGDVLVDVFQGRAEVRTGSDTALLGAGESWRHPSDFGASAVLDPVRAVRVDAEIDEGQATAAMHPILEPSRPLPRRVAADEVPEVDPSLIPYSELMEAHDDGRLMLADVDGFLETHPDSMFAREARVWRLERLAEEVDPADALFEVESWLARYPSSPRFAEVHYLRATLLRDRLENCEAAVPSYLVVIDSGPQRLAREARKYVERCQAE